MRPFPLVIMAACLVRSRGQQTVVTGHLDCWLETITAGGTALTYSSLCNEKAALLNLRFNLSLECFGLVDDLATLITYAATSDEADLETILPPLFDSYMGQDTVDQDAEGTGTLVEIVANLPIRAVQVIAIGLLPFVNDGGPARPAVFLGWKVNKTDYTRAQGRNGCVNEAARLTAIDADIGVRYRCGGFVEDDDFVYKMLKAELPVNDGIYSEYGVGCADALVRMEEKHFYPQLTVESGSSTNELLAALSETFYVNETRSMAALDVDFPTRSNNDNHWDPVPLFLGELTRRADGIGGNNTELQSIGFNVRAGDGSVVAHPTVPGNHSVHILARDMHGTVRMNQFRYKDEVTFLEQDIEVRVRPPLSRRPAPSAACMAAMTSVANTLTRSSYVVEVPVRVGGLSEDCSRVDLFENVANDDFGELAYTVVVDYSDGTVGSAAFNFLGREAYMSPPVAGPASGRLTVSDSREVPLTLFDWNFTVHEAPPDFALISPQSAGCTEVIDQFRTAAERRYTVGESKIISGFDPARCSAEELYDGNNLDQISYQLSFPDGAPGPDVFVNGRTAAISIAPNAVGSFAAELLATDGAGATVVVLNWTILVTEPANGLTLGSAEQQDGEFDSVDYLQWSNRTQWAIGTTYTLAPVRLGGTIMLQGQEIDAALVSYYLSPTPSGLYIDSTTGEIHGTPRRAERVRAVLSATAAFDGSAGATEIASITFDVLPADVSDPANGPNGRGCENNGAVIDLVEFDSAFTCSCAATHTGANCADAALSAQQEEGDTTVLLAIFIPILAILALVLGFFGWRHRQHQVLMNKPHSFDVTQESLCLTAASEGEVDGMTKVPRELPRTCVTLMNELGAGEFGVVFKALVNEIRGSFSHSIPEYAVAVKSLKTDPSGSERADFLREALITAQFDHENVIGLVGVVTRGQPALIVLQFCEKGSLEGIIEDAADAGLKLGTGTLIRYAHGIACGMAYLASRSFVHRDLASRNVLVDALNRPKVCDFGLSRDLDSSTYYTMAQTAGAKIPVRWTAPEALEHARYGESSDVWSFGITVIELFMNGEEPYRGWQNAYVGEMVLDGHVHPCPKDCPQALYNSAIKPCLRAGSSERPQFAELADRLARLAESMVDTPAAADADGYLDIEEGAVVGDPSLAQSGSQTWLGPRSVVKPETVQPNQMPSAGVVTMTGADVVDDARYMAPGVRVASGLYVQPVSQRPAATAASHYEQPVIQNQGTTVADDAHGFYTSPTHPPTDDANTKHHAYEFAEEEDEAPASASASSSSASTGAVTTADQFGFGSQDASTVDIDGALTECGLEV